jgi:hypothetical protein
MAQSTRVVPPSFSPARRGGGEALRLLYWQAPTILNTHFAVGTKDVAASRVVSEPLFSIAPDGTFMPILTAEIPQRRERWPLARWHRAIQDRRLQARGCGPL